MSNIMNQIKELREKTGAGFLDCKKSLEENDNDIEKSIEFLRKKGLAKASKKSDRAANEGAVGVYSNKEITVLIKVNSETDFAAKSDTFLNFLDTLGEVALNHNNNIDKDQFLNLQLEKGTVADYFNSMIAKIGENLILNNLIIKENKNFEYAYYIHNSYRSNIGKIVSMLQYSSNKKDAIVETLSKNLCMHIAAMKPESLDIHDLDKTLVSNEEKIRSSPKQKPGFKKSHTTGPMILTQAELKKSQNSNKKSPSNDSYKIKRLSSKGRRQSTIKALDTDTLEQVDSSIGSNTNSNRQFFRHADKILGEEMGKQGQGT